MITPEIMSRAAELALQGVKVVVLADGSMTFEPVTMPKGNAARCARYRMSKRVEPCQTMSQDMVPAPSFPPALSSPEPPSLPPTHTPPPIRVKGTKAQPPVLEFPEDWSDARAETMTLWLDYKLEKNQRYKPLGFKALISHHSKQSDAEFAADVEFSMSKMYDGIFPDKSGSPRGANGEKKQWKINLG